MLPTTNAPEQMAHSVLANINSITIDNILDIQRKLEPYDMVSLVFLLYDTPDTALQRLITYQRVYKDLKSNNLNLLYDWALYTQSKPSFTTWKYKFLEALTICRLYNVIKKLGFNILSIKQHYQPENIYVSVYIHPVKKLLYRLCENITLDTFLKLKETLISYDMEVIEHEHCEMMFLELMCKKFIIVNQTDGEGMSSTMKRIEVSRLVEIIECYDSLKTYAVQLREIQSKLNNEPYFPISDLTSKPAGPKGTITEVISKKGTVGPEDFKETFQLFTELNLEDIPLKNLKSDTLQLRENCYPIINPKRVGVCCIINQEKFHPSKESINTRNQNILRDRAGSRRDQHMLEMTMAKLNFVVKSERNLKYQGIFEFIKKCIQSSIKEDSMFMLCILSHGVMGHIFSADSLKVKVDDIQNLLDSDDALHLRGKPKILIMQACRVDEEPPVSSPRLVADSVSTDYYLRKSHFLVYWATAPAYEAFRDEKMGSIFVQTLCYVINKVADREQFCDICTMVTDYVTNFCTKKQHLQVPLFESSLRKKLYLCNPVV